MASGLALHQISIKASRYLEKGGIDAQLPALRQVSRPFHHITWDPRSSQWDKKRGFFSGVRPTKYRPQRGFSRTSQVIIYIYVYIYVYMYIYMYIYIYP